MIAVVMLVVVGTAVMAAAQSAEEGVASFYSDNFQGKKTASGEAYDKNGLTAAHKKLAYGAKVKVTNVANGKSVVVTVNDRMAASNPAVIDVAPGGRGARFHQCGKDQGQARSPEVSDSPRSTRCSAAALETDYRRPATIPPSCGARSRVTPSFTLGVALMVSRAFEKLSVRPFEVGASTFLAASVI